MNLKNYFDISRFWLLMKMELYKSRKGIFMIFMISFGLLFFPGLLMTPIFEPTLVVYDFSEGYAFNLIMGGFILSSLTFGDLGRSLKRHHYLTLPASTLEKFLCMWLLSSVGWIIAYTVFYIIYTAFANVVGQILLSYMTFVPFQPLGEFSLMSMKYYFVTQGIFLVGATHFKGYVFPKILISLILFAMVAAFISYFVLNNVIDSEVEECISETNILDGSSVYRVWTVAVWLFWWILAPVCWIIAYFGLKEKEV